MIYDVVIVGASLAGSALGLLLARDGYRVALVEKETFPRDKLCGEGLFPDGVQVLRRLGLLDALAAASPVPFRTLQIVAPPARVSFPLPAEGLLFARRAADCVLARAVSSHSNLAFFEGTRAENIRAANGAAELAFTGRRDRTLRARVVVGADGARSQIRRLASIPWRPSGMPRFALGAHVAEALTPPGQVQVHLGPRGEAYLATQAGQSSAALLLRAEDQRRRGADLRSLFAQRLAEFPEFCELAARLQFCGPVISTAPLAIDVTRCASQRLLLVGDAAGTMDPILGQGMSVALRDATTAAAVLARAFERGDFSERTLSSFAGQRHRYFLPLRRSAAALVWLSRQRKLAQSVLSTLERFPNLCPTVLRWATRLN